MGAVEVAAACGDLGESLPRQAAGAAPELGVDVGAARQTRFGLVEAVAEHQRLSEQAPRERLRSACRLAARDLEHVAGVVLDTAAEVVAVEVVLADAVMDVEHPGQLRVVGRRTEAIDLEQQPFPPGPAVVAHDGDRLVRRGDVVGTTEPLRESAAGLGLHHRGVWRAGLAQPVRTGGQHADPLAVVGPPCEGRLGGVEVLASRSQASA